MGENPPPSKNQLPHHQVFDASVDVAPHAGTKCFDDDGRLKRTGTVCIASFQIITAVLASDIQSLDWAMAQLRWVAGPALMFLFSFVTYYTTNLLAACYRSGDPIAGRRNYTLTDAVRTNLGGAKVAICGLVQFFNIFGVAICCTIASAISMMAIERSTCFLITDGKDPCQRSINPYMIVFGVAQLIFSQIPDLDRLWLLSVVANVTSITNSVIGLALAVTKLAETGKFSGSLTGMSIGTGTQIQKIWRSFQALGNIAFGFSNSINLIEIQDMLRSPPSDVKTIKKASLSVAVIILFNMLCSCTAYAAYGDNSPGSLLSGFYYPYWPLVIANAALAIHLVGAYQVCCQSLYAFIEKNISTRFPDSEFITKDIVIPIPVSCPYNKLNLFRLVWRTTFVITTTVISMLLPFFNDVVGLLGALGFWPLTIYFPVELYIVQKKIPKWSARWLCLQTLSVACLFVTTAAAAGSVAGVVHDLKSYKPFKTTY